MEHKDRFKFRIWDKQEKKMYYHDTKDNDFIINCKGEVVKVSLSGDRSGYPLFLVEHLNQDRFTQLQCTGLKDKNNKLIYERDFVEYYGYKILIIFKDGCFGLDKPKDFLPFYHSNGLKAEVFCEIIEVIGNIYENPELLEVKNGTSNL